MADTNATPSNQHEEIIPNVFYTVTQDAENPAIKHYTLNTKVTPQFLQNNLRGKKYNTRVVLDTTLSYTNADDKTAGKLKRTVTTPVKQLGFAVAPEPSITGSIATVQDNYFIAESGSTDFRNFSITDRFQVTNLSDYKDVPNNAILISCTSECTVNYTNGRTGASGTMELDENSYTVVEESDGTILLYCTIKGVADWLTDADKNYNHTLIATVTRKLQYTTPDGLVGSKSITVTSEAKSLGYCIVPTLNTTEVASTLTNLYVKHTDNTYRGFTLTDKFNVGNRTDYSSVSCSAQITLTYKNGRTNGTGTKVLTKNYTYNSSTGEMSFGEQLCADWLTDADKEYNHGISATIVRTTTYTATAANGGATTFTTKTASISMVQAGYCVVPILNVDDLSVSYNFTRTINNNTSPATICPNTFTINLMIPSEKYDTVTANIRPRTSNTYTCTKYLTSIPSSGIYAGSIVDTENKVPVPIEYNFSVNGVETTGKVTIRIPYQNESMVKYDDNHVQFSINYTMTSDMAVAILNAKKLDTNSYSVHYVQTCNEVIQSSGCDQAICIPVVITYQKYGITKTVYISINQTKYDFITIGPFSS